MSEYPIVKRVVFSDFDETIVDINTFKISSKLSSYLKSHTSLLSLVIVTSRGWDGLKPYAKALNLKVPQIIESGAKIIDPITEKVLFENSISRRALRQIYLLSTTVPLRVTFSCGLESHRDIKLLPKFSNIGRLSLIVRPEFYKETVTKLKFIKEIHFACGEGMMDNPEEYLIDITPVSIDKLAGMKKWLSEYGENVEELYVAGNSEGDIPLFKLKKKNKRIVKVAVQNAVMSLQKKADVIIPPPQNNGFYLFLAQTFRNTSESNDFWGAAYIQWYSLIQKTRVKTLQFIQPAISSPKYIYGYVRPNSK
ncbi:MAG: Cof-type HAD-IIB family hydrolase [bacterium]|nr:Cof-type HAD-IIB family hydrolase [bacterium]